MLSFNRVKMVTLKKNMAAITHNFVSKSNTKQTPLDDACLPFLEFLGDGKDSFLGQPFVPIMLSKMLKSIGKCSDFLP